MLEGTLRIHDRLIWQPHDLRNREEVVVTDIGIRPDDEVWLLLTGPSGSHWNDVDLVREACEWHPRQLPEFYRGATAVEAPFPETFYVNVDPPPDPRPQPSS